MKSIPIRQVSPSESWQEQEQLKEMLDEGIVRPSSPWASPDG